jgi:catechol 2,3-dioxygenase-like lactoylglutathione lyase family enzyme
LQDIDFPLWRRFRLRLCFVQQFFGTQQGWTAASKWRIVVVPQRHHPRKGHLQMKRELRIISLCAAAVSSGLASDAVAPAIGYDNVHIRVSDPAKAVEWYVKYLGATTPTAGQLYFGKALIAVVKTADPHPSTGSAIDHIGLSYANLDDAMKSAEAGGAKIISPPRESPGIFRFAYIEDPWGVKIEMVEDPELLGFHHVHLRVRDPEATLRWYQQMFGGERASLKGRVDGLRYGGIWLFAAASGTDTPAPSSDRAIMSVGLQVSKIDQAAAALRSRGIPFPVEPRQLGDLWYAFAEDPNGVRVELLQRPTK